MWVKERRNCFIPHSQGRFNVWASPHNDGSGLAGDHSVVPIQAVPFGREVGRGLYFADAREGLTLCSPWMEYAECPECHNWEVTIPEFSSKDDTTSTC